MVRHWTLTPAFTGSSPVIPAKHHEAVRGAFFLEYIFIAFKRCDMAFEKEAVVRYSEVDVNGVITIDAIVDYLQDVVMLHSEVVGMGMRQVKEMGTVWFLSTWQIEILRAPKIYEKIIVKTNPYGFKGFFGNRNVWIEDENGEMLVRANSIWVYLDLHGMVPRRIDEAAAAPYLPLEPMLDMNYSSRKIAMPTDFAPLASTPVRYSQLDTNGHVNNCEYIRTAMEVADIKEMPRQIRAEYKKSALPNNVFYPFISKDSKDIYVDLRDEDGVAYATIVFEY